MDKEIEHRQRLIEKITELEQELEHRKNRLEQNMLAEVCQKSILAQRKVIFILEMQLNHLDYKLQHNLP